MFYRMIARPSVVVEWLGEADHRVGQAIKFRCVCYKDGKGRLTTRHEDEFHRLFAPVETQPHHD